jgi:hypothetical protein
MKFVLKKILNKIFAIFIKNINFLLIFELNKVLISERKSSFYKIK